MDQLLESWFYRLLLWCNVLTCHPLIDNERGRITYKLKMTITPNIVDTQTLEENVLMHDQRIPNIQQ